MLELISAMNDAPTMHAVTAERSFLAALEGGCQVPIGALAVGNVKYQTQHRLLVRMAQSEKALVLSFAEAFAAAREFLAEQAAQASAKPVG